MRSLSCREKNLASPIPQEEQRETDSSNVLGAVCVTGEQQI